MPNIRPVLTFPAAIFISLFVLFAQIAQAHEIRPAVLDLTIADDRQVTLVMEVNAEAVLAGIGPEHDDTDDAPQKAEYDKLRQLDPAVLATHMTSFAPNWLNGLALPWTFKSFEAGPVGDTDLDRLSKITLQLTPDADATSLQLVLPVMPGDIAIRVHTTDTPNAANHWVKAGDTLPTISLNGEIVKAGFIETVGQYLYLGYIHILPAGLDHILFVLGLFLLSLKMRPLLWQVSAFTAAHTLTLGLSIYGVIALPASIVEPLIAFSIAVVAIENILRSELSKWRIWVVTGFGLLHGMGFAGVLLELGLPQDQYLTALLSFNVGVEIGQLSVILLAFLAVGFWGRGKDWYRPFVVIPGSLFIAAIGLWWTFERVFLGG